MHPRPPPPHPGYPPGPPRGGPPTPECWNAPPRPGGSFMRPPPGPRHGPGNSQGTGRGFPRPPVHGPPVHRPDFRMPPPPFPPHEGMQGPPPAPHWNGGPRPPPQPVPFNQRSPHPPPYQGPTHRHPTCRPPPPFHGPPARGPHPHPADFVTRAPPPAPPQGPRGGPAHPPNRAPPPHFQGGPGSEYRFPPSTGHHQHQGPPGPSGPPTPSASDGGHAEFGPFVPRQPDLNRGGQEVDQQNTQDSYLPAQWDGSGAVTQEERGSRSKDAWGNRDIQMNRRREQERTDAAPYHHRSDHQEGLESKDPDRFHSRHRDDDDDYKKQYHQDRDWKHKPVDMLDYPPHNHTGQGSGERSRNNQVRGTELKDTGTEGSHEHTGRCASETRSQSQDRTGSSRESQTRYERERDRDRDRERPRYTDRDRERDRNRGRDQDRHRDRDRERTRDRERDRGSDKDRDRGRDRDRERGRERDRIRDRSPLRDSSKEPAERSSGRNERSSDRDKRSSSRDERSSSRDERPRSSRVNESSRDQHDAQREGRSRTSPRTERRDRTSVGREPSGGQEDRRSQGPKWDPSKPRERWNELERKLREEEEAQEQDLDLSLGELDPFEDLDQDDGAVDDEPWVQCSQRENFLSITPSDQRNGSSVAATEKLKDLLGRFETEIVERGPRVRASQPQPEQKKPDLHWHIHNHDHSDSESSESDSDSDSDASSDEEDKEYDHRITCLENRANHPWRLTDNLWFNEPGEMNDGPLCKCSIKQKRSGIRHNIYPGEGPIPPCDPHTNNASRLRHYRVTISPTANFLTPTQTVIVYDKREYIFEGFSLFSHHSLDEVPECKMVRFGREYTLHFFSEPMPEHFTVRGLNLFARFLFEEILELWDFDFKGKEGGCHHFHFLPRFARLLGGSGKELLSMHHVVQYLLRSSKPIVDAARLTDWLAVSEPTWQRYVDRLRHMIATRPGKKPSSIRIDQVDRDQREPDKVTFPVIVHFGVRPAQLSYIRDPNYRKLLKSFSRLRHLLLNKPRVTNADKVKLAEKEASLQKMRVQNCRTREVTAVVSCQDMLATGIGMDMCQHALMLPVLVSHLRYFSSLTNMYSVLDYKFKDPMLLRYAMTHPSYKLYYGTNPDHVRNTLYNCGIRFKQDYTESKKMLAKERKKGINQLYRIMSLMGSDDEIPSHVKNYERLEFLGDAVIEFLTSTHLYHLFPELEEGGLASYRVALVQNQHLSVLAKKLELDRYMLYAHGPDLCRPYDLRHAMANCLEAVMGALYLEAGLGHVRKFFGRLLFEEDRFNNIWLGHPKDPLQLDFPKTDRHLIENSPILQKLTKFEESTGITFRHIRLLARAFTQRTVGYTDLTRGSNQRLEFLGDSVLQLVVSTYLYKHFPDHHEGHLSLLRSSLVNNKIQSIVAQDLGLTDYIIDTKTRSKTDGNIPMKIMADLVEALIGAMYVDRGLDIVDTFCGVVFFPRLKDFIMTQDWNDAKSQLQQCCLTLRVEGQEPDVPTYKVISQSGPTNSRQYLVAVYFRSRRMATGAASNIQDAQMEAAKNALRRGNFPHLWFQRKCVMLRREREAQMGAAYRDWRKGRGEGERRREGAGRSRGGESEERSGGRGGGGGSERRREESQEMTRDMRGLLRSNKERDEREKQDEQRKNEDKKQGAQKLADDGQSERRDHQMDRKERSRERSENEREQYRDRDRGRSDRGRDNDKSDDGRSERMRPERSHWRDDSTSRSSAGQRRDRVRSPERRHDRRGTWIDRRDRQSGERSSWDRHTRRDDGRGGEGWRENR